MAVDPLGRVRGIVSSVAEVGVEIAVEQVRATESGAGRHKPPYDGHCNAPQRGLPAVSSAPSGWPEPACPPELQVH